MSVTTDMWKSPAWGFQSKADARWDLGVTNGGGGGNAEGVIGPWTGNVYFVSNNGSASVTGTDKDNPLLSITGALAFVTAGNNDVIVVLDYAALSRADETWPITLTSSHNNLTIMGVPYGNIGSNAVYPDEATTAAFAITTANQIRLIDLNIGGYASGDYGVHFTGAAAAWRCSIIGCHFGTSGTTDWGIYVTGDPPQLLVESCDFHSGLTEGGIYVANCTRGDFIGNSFHVNSGDRGIEFSTSQADFGKILGNTFMVADAANGEAIYCAGVFAGGIEMIAGNVSVKSNTNSSSTDAFVYEPYWWDGAGAMGVGVGPNSPDPLAYYRQFMPVGGGRMIFVNGGSDGPTDNNHDGTTPQMAKQTITEAITLVTAGQEDVIFVLNYGSNARAAETWPIAIAKDQFSIIGQGRSSTKWPLITATGSNLSAFNFTTGDRVTLKNLNIGGTSGGSGAGVLVQAGNSPWGIHIENCQFGYEGSAGTYGVDVNSAGDAPYLTVTDSIFGNALTDSGVLIAGNATRGWIGKPGHGNVFEPATNQIGIEVTGGATQVKIFDNYFIELSDAADGEAISLGGSSASCAVMGNHATSNDVAVPTNNAYDDSSSGTNSWGDNYHPAATGTTAHHLPA